MSKHTIEIEGLPEGWEVSNRGIEINRELVRNESAGVMQMAATVFLQKTKQRRIVLEETGEVSRMTHFINTGDVQLHIQSDKIWREVKEGE